VSEARPAALERAVAERALRDPADPALAAAVMRLAEAAGASLVGLVFFGSRCSGAARANEWSAYDVFVLVEDYRAFYRAAREAGLSGKGPGLLSIVSRWLPPTQYSLRFEAEGIHVKAAVVRHDTFRRETSPRRRDHFVIGRLFQPARLVHARDEAARRSILDGLAEAVRETWGWAGPWLPAEFDAAAYGRSALRTSMRWEVRPEPAGRADALWEAQRDEQVPVLAALLGELDGRGDVVAAAGRPGWYAAARPFGSLARLGRSLYFRRSIVRATSRWAKHVVSFEGWLDYIVRKASRHTGEPIVLTERERRWPWVFLWGRLARYLREKNAKGAPR
jgi:hypothetical protein